MLPMYTKPVITFQTAQAGKITAEATYSVVGGNKEYRMVISRYTDLRSVSIKCYVTGGGGNERGEDEQHTNVGKSGKGYFVTWKYWVRGEKSIRIYLPEDFENIYKWGI